MASYKLVTCVLFLLVGIGVSSATRALLNYDSPTPPWFHATCPGHPYVGHGGLGANPCRVRRSRVGCSGAAGGSGEEADGPWSKWWRGW
ncbi:hypothetical protein L484_018983 [Morus notabilis]|uniref:Uncharacterized protein n=1 Tax=Morus notabilis TaxID=981085 RepID=W9RSQ6_9ROSA|nr:hypothetical protein L484_018983 [Morus notabilis]